MKFTFTDEEMEMAIMMGIFDSHNNTIANPAKVIRFFETWATLKSKDLRRAAAEIALTSETPDEAHRKIMNL